MIYILDIARGIAALWVFLFHTKELFVQSSHLIYSIAEYGSLGVPMFFVISGYVITFSAESTLNKDESPFYFLKRRFLRIYPTYWFSILVVLLTPFVIETISMFKSGQFITPDIRSTQMSAKEWLHFIVLSKVFFAGSADLQSQFNIINSVYWTLAIEFQFYLVVFLSLFFKKYYRRLILIITITSFATVIIPLNLNYGLFLHYWHIFSVGILLAYLQKSPIRINNLIPTEYSSYVSVILSIFILFFSVVALSNYRVGPFVFSTCFATLLWSIQPFENLLSGIRNQKQYINFWILQPFLYLGAMSYSVYLLHGKIYGLPNMFVRQLIPKTNIFYGVLTILGTLALYFPFYFYIEKRFMSKDHTKIHNSILKKSIRLA